MHGLARRTVVCDPARLATHEDVHIVGFFGDRREIADKDVIDRSELDLIADFVHHPGLITYSSVELVDNYWANLVVHREADDREQWRGSEVHRHAVDEIAPMAYHGVRIHNGCVVGGIPGPGTVILESTKYWDYDVSPTWHGVRLLPGGERTRLAGPVDPPSPETGP